MYNFIGDYMEKIETSEIVDNAKKIKNSANYYLIISIIFLIFGSILTTNPGNVVTFISYIIGGMLLLIGIIRIISFIYMKKKYDIVKISDVVTGSILCILGIIACIWGSTVETVIRIVIGAWILYCGITKLISSFSLNKYSDKKNNIVLIISILMIVVGLATIMIKYIEFMALGILIIIYSILDIIGYILYHNNKGFQN